jgi:hypothetical protein
VLVLETETLYTRFTFFDITIFSGYAAQSPNFHTNRKRCPLFIRIDSISPKVEDGEAVK